jgi:choline dehydrogenase-like flavoprotein
VYLKREELPAAAAVPWEVIVVGAGAVGLVLAVSLARTGKRVLLLESGTRNAADANDLNEVIVTGRAHDGALHGRGRTVGGTTTLWGGQLTRFLPYDFDARESTADCKWPIRFEDVEPYYVDVAAMLDLDCKYQSDESVRSALNSPAFGEGSPFEVFFTRWLREPNLARYFSAELDGLESMSVAPACHATEILGQARRITGIKARDFEGGVHDFHARKVVLACGTIEISRLLLLTAKKAPDLDWAQNPNIGRYFQDHVDLVVGQIELQDRRAFSDIFENALIEGHKYMPKIRMRTAVLREAGCLNIAGNASFDSSIAEDVALLKHFVKSLMRGARIDKPWQTLKRMAGLGRIWFPLIWRYLRHRRILAIADRGISLIAHCEQRPMRDSRISLDAGRVDRFGDPVARLHWVIDERMQVDSLQFFTTRLTTFLAKECRAQLNVLPALLSGDVSVLEQARDSYHQCGGACMALGADDGVVDANCKVFGTDNLYVAGAAVFPTSSFANPTYTAMALARRLGDHLTVALQ